MVQREVGLWARSLVAVLTLSAPAGAPGSPPAAPAPALTATLGTPLFAVVNGDGKVVNFAWWAVKGATGGYEVFRATDPQATADKVATAPSGTLGAADAHPLSTGTYYQLVAIGPGGTKASSAWTFVNTPTVTSLTARGPDVVIAWSTIRAAPAGYEIWRTADPARAPVRVGSVPAGTLTFTDKLAAGSGNFYQVVALGGGARAASAFQPYQLPTAPVATPLNPPLSTPATSAQAMNSAAPGLASTIPRPMEAALAQSARMQNSTAQSAARVGSPNVQTSVASSTQPCASLCVTAVTLTSIQVQWPPYQGADGTATHYVVTRQAVPSSCNPYTPACGLGVRSVADVRPSGSAYPTATAIHLLPSTTYAITVEALGTNSTATQPISTAQGGGVAPAAQTMPEKVLGRPQTVLVTTSGLQTPQNVRVGSVPHCDYLLHVTWDGAPGDYGYRASDGWDTRSTASQSPYVTLDDRWGDYYDAFGSPAASHEVYMRQVGHVPKDVDSFTIVAVLPRYTDDGQFPPPMQLCFPTGCVPACSPDGSYCFPDELMSPPSTPVNGPQYDATQADNSACGSWVPVDAKYPDGPYVFQPPH